MTALSPQAKRLGLLLHQAGITPQFSLLLCVSGGSDSVALLHLFLEFAPAYRLHLLHFHHGLRPEADQDATWVQELAESNRLPLHLRVHHGLSHLRSGVPAIAREWRRSEALRLRELLELDFVVQAHHADDLLETRLHHWLRGVHLAHLEGMKFLEGPWLRPLLSFSKVELQDYLEELRINWREDLSNTDTRYTRNYLRHEVIPRLNQVAGGGLVERLENLATQSRALGDYLKMERTRLWSQLVCPEDPTMLRATGVAELPDLLCWEVLHHWLEETGCRVAFERVKGLTVQLKRRPRDRWTWELGRGCRVCAKSGRLWRNVSVP